MITRFRSLTEPHGHAPVGLTWEAWFAELEASAARPRGEDGWSPATFAFRHRSKDDAESVFAVVLDFDHGPSLEALAARYARFYGLVHTTRRSTAEAPRCRVILPLAGPATPAEHAALMAQALGDAAELEPDEGTRDPSRFWFMPGAGDQVQRLAGAERYALRATPIAREVGHTGPASDHDRYTARALDSAEDAVARAPEGARNATLNREAYAVAGLTGDVPAVRQRLTRAAKRAGLPEAEAEDVVARAVRAGAAKPRLRSVPTPTHPEAVRLEPVAEGWESQLHRGPKGGLEAGQHNANVILANHPAVSGLVRWNEHAQSLEATRPPPGHPDAGSWPRPWSNSMDSAVRAWLEGQRCKVGSDVVRAALELAGLRSAYHPVRDYFDRCVEAWDRQPRIGRWLVDVFGVEPSDYASAVGSAWLVSVCARTYQPGCKVDHVLVVEGGQGLRKSTVFRALLPDEAWFTDHLDLGSREAALQLQGKTIVELAELAGVARADTESLKAFVSTPVDHVRRPYEARPVSLPRQSVFCASVNGSEYLRDDTGNRRWWPVLARQADPEWVTTWRDQLWGEAASWYHDGRQWWLDADTERTAAQEQDARMMADPWEEILGRYCTGRTEVGLPELYAHLGLETKALSARDRLRVGAIMRRIGMAKVKRRAGLALEWGFRRPDW